MSGYQPLGITAVDHEALTEGVSVWLRTSLLEWTRDQCGHFSSNRPGYRGLWNWYLDQFREIERIFHITLTGDTRITDGATAWKGVESLAEKYPEYFLEVVNLLLSKMNERYKPEKDIEKLARILTEGGSAWRVAKRTETYCLERRVDETVVAAAERAMAVENSSGQLLASAWSNALGRNPNPGDAYDDAIKAVEAAGVATVSPSNARATLGTMIKDIKQAPHKWTFALPVARHVDPINMVINMMETLWTSQSGRHGNAAVVHVENTQAEAEMAIMLAVPLVQWFADGTISRQP